MKKLFGCLLVLALLFVAACIAAYLFLFKPLKGMSEDWSNAIAELREVEALNEQIENDDPFDAPKDGLLTEEQVARFVAVAGSIEETASTEIEALRTKYQELGDAEGGPLQALRPRLALEALGDLAETLHNAKLAQVTALNEQDFSQAEYAWVRTEFYRAGGMAILPVDVSAIRELDISNLEDLRNLPGLSEDMGKVETPDEEAPNRNAELVEPYRDHLNKWAQFAVFGL